MEKSEPKVARKASLRYSFAKTMVLLVLVAQGVTIAIALQFAWRDAQARAHDAMEVAYAVAESFLYERRDQLASSVQVLTQDFGLRKAVATGSLPTADSALRNHAQRVGADHAMLLDAAGEVLSSSDETLLVSDAVWQVAQSGTDRILLAESESGLYQLVVAPIKAPQIVGWASIGFAVDTELAERVQAITGSRVSFVGTEGQRSYATSAPLMNADQALTLAKPLDAVGVDVTLVLARDRFAALSAFFAVRNSTLWVSLIAVLLAGIAGTVLARRLTKSLSSLAVAATRMQDGDYDNELVNAQHAEVADLAASLNGMQGEIADREQRLHHQAHYDNLTNLPNQRELLSFLSRRLQERDGGVVMVCVVRGLQELNSSLGLQFGDAAIQAVSQTLDGDGVEYVARVADTRFLLVVSGGVADAEVLAADLVQRCELLRLSEAVSVRVDLHFGARVIDPHLEPQALMREAWGASLKAMEELELLSWYEPAQGEAQERRLTIMRDLRSAVLDDQLYLLFQPKLDLRRGRFVAAEALLRWEHPELGAVPVDEFIEVAEQTRDINRLTKWVLENACLALTAWRHIDPEFGVAVNISPHDLTDPDFAATVERVLASLNLPGNALELEVTERAFVKDPQQCIATLDQLRAMGISVAIDDYGTGFSSLEQLNALPATVLKIDKGFVMTLQSDPHHQAIVRSTIELAHALDMETVAEGVEDAETVVDLGSWGCTYAQGFHLSRPISVAAIEEFLNTPYEIKGRQQVSEVQSS